MKERPRPPKKLHRLWYGCRVRMPALEQQLAREAAVENAELAGELRMVEARTRLQGFAARYIARVLVVVPMVLVAYLACKVVLLRKTYPVAFKWYDATFGSMYPFARSKTQQTPSASFRSLWNVCINLSYSSLSGALSLLAIEKTLRPEQATFLYLCAHHFGKDGTAKLTAEKWDYPDMSKGVHSPWYVGLTQRWLPLPATSASGVAKQPSQVEDEAWVRWMATSADNPFFGFFPPVKEQFFGVPVVKQYLFVRRGLLTTDLEYLYFGGLCFAAEMCSVDTETPELLFNRFFTARVYQSVSCGARTANASVDAASTGVMSAFMIPSPYSPAFALGGMLIGGIGGAAIQRYKCELEKDSRIGHWTSDDGDTSDSTMDTDGA